MQQRAGRYLMSMGIRTLCVILVILVPGPLRWVFAVGAIVLPYIAVVAANAHGERREPPLQGPPPAVGRSLPPPPAHPAEPVVEPVVQPFSQAGGQPFAQAGGQPFAQTGGQAFSPAGGQPGSQAGSSRGPRVPSSRPAPDRRVS
jgi:hypothetical protein